MARKIDREMWNEKLRAIGMSGRLPESLTERVLEAVRGRPLGERYTLPDGEVPGMYLDVSAEGTALLMLSYRTKGGVRRQHKIATVGEVALRKARELAQKAISAVKDGGDPVEDKRAARLEAERAKSNTMRAYLEGVYGPKVLAHRKDGGMPKARKPGAKPKPSGTWARILSAWEPLLPVELEALSRDAIEKVLADRKGAKKSAGTLIRDWGALRAMLADAVDRGQLAAVPMARRPEPIRKLRGNQRVRYLGQRDSEEERAKGEGEEKRFDDALAKFTSDEPGGGDFLRCTARLALATGMRRGEIVRLTDKLINKRERRIDLTQEITKSYKARPVFLSDAALAALEPWKIRGKGGELFPGEGKPDEVAERYEDRITQREWPRLCAAAKLEDFHFHDLRHDFAVRLLRSCGSLAKVRDALGHASVAQTEKYAHVVDSEVRDAVLGEGRRVS